MPIPNIDLLKSSASRLYDFWVRYHEPDADPVMGLSLIKRESSVLLKQAFKFWYRIRRGRR